eukprot:CAMPEP_0181298434 /NCGR_PEP_ID=MMETSP1101-20121128/5779_1 /TAXON_ID=46948 /ORGANISM="Rhodomonas abbreviata, Strain Caron Lab Isolate" /LENGTH=47 /DNA_ID= /DNA_START= /DNA_END= /DNA_ORIENTATION=
MEAEEDAILNSRKQWDWWFTCEVYKKRLAKAARIEKASKQTTLTENV